MPLPRFAVFVIFAAAWLLTGGLARAAAAPPLAPNGKPYNFIVMMADDLGAKELACYGNTEHRTPQLDKLAAEGMRFQTCYATPICTSTRVMIMTGQYGFNSGYFNFMLRAYSPQRTSPLYDIGSKFTFADALKPAGYTTGLAGKWQLTGKIPDLIHDCGFDEYRMWAYKGDLPPGVKHTGGWENEKGQKTSRYWHPSIVENAKYLPTKPDDYGPDLYSDFLVDFITRHKDRPFFFYYPMALTHSPWDEVPDLKHPGKRLGKGLKNNVEYMDHIVGKVVAAVDRLGLTQNTIILFTGDNGTGGMGKGTVTELGARVPLIVRCPGTVKAGVVSDELADLTDVMPTLMEFAGTKPPQGHVIDGVSLASTLRGGSGEHRPWIFSYLGDGRILRDKRWLMEREGSRVVRFYDCGSSRDGRGYKDVTQSTDPEVQAARKRFDDLLATKLPGPEDREGLVPPGKNAAAGEDQPKGKGKGKGKGKQKQSTTS